MSDVEGNPSFQEMVQELRDTTRSERQESMEKPNKILQETNENMSRLAEESQRTQKLMVGYKKETDGIKNLVKKMKESEKETKDELKEIVKNLQERVESLEDFVKWYAEEYDEENEDDDAGKERKDKAAEEAELRREGHLQETHIVDYVAYKFKRKEREGKGRRSYIVSTSSNQEGREAESIAEKIRKVNEETQRKGNEAKEKESDCAENGSIWCSAT